MIKKLLLSLCLYACLSIQVGQCSEATYQTTETELTKLETIFAELKNSNEVQIAALNQSKTELTIAQDDLKKYRLELDKQKEILTALKAELSKARNTLQATRDELQKVNKSLKISAQEEKRKQNKLKIQRNILATIAVIAAAKAA